MTERIKNGNYPVAENLKRIIEERMLHKPDIARQAGLSPRNLSDILSGSKLIRASEISKIADALRIDVSELFR